MRREEKGTHTCYTHTFLPPSLQGGEEAGEGGGEGDEDGGGEGGEDGGGDGGGEGSQLPGGMNLDKFT